jgi:hypothetical protein
LTGENKPAENATMHQERDFLLNTPTVELEFIRADADYFRTKARQCFRMARRASSEASATTLRSLAETFETKARALDDEDR